MTPMPAYNSHTFELGGMKSHNLSAICEKPSKLACLNTMGLKTKVFSPVSPVDTQYNTPVQTKDATDHPVQKYY